MPLTADAKCPECGRKARYYVEEEMVRCECGLNVSYDDYIEMMTGRLTTLVPGYRSPFVKKEDSDEEG